MGKGFQIGACHNSTFKVFYKIHNQELLNASIKIGITIKDDYHKPLFTFNSTFIGQELKVIKEEGSVICSIKSFNLVPGDYEIHIWFVINGDKEVIIESAGKLSVVENDVYKTGILPNPFYHGNTIHENFSFK